jgi:hypothetical protein
VPGQAPPPWDLARIEAMAEAISSLTINTDIFPEECE